MRRLVLWLALLGPALAAAGCRSQALPYEGKSVAELEAMLADPDPTRQAQGAYGLSRLGPEGRLAAPALIDGLKSPSVVVRERCAHALGMVGAAEGVPALAASLRDPEWSVRRHAA